MASGAPEQAVCKWCGAKLEEGEEVCPLCRRPTAPAQIQPLDGPDRSTTPPPAPQPRQWERPQDRGPLPAAPGQEEFGSWANIRQIMRGDKLFAAVLVLMALQVLLALLAHRWFSATISGLMLWGVITFRSWGFWIAVTGAGSIVMGWLLLLFGTGLLAQFGLPAFALILPFALGTAVLHSAARLFWGFGLVISGFMLWVLWTRKDMFD